MPDKPPRRNLRFNSLDEVVADVENLRVRGYEKGGNWNVAQVAGHLANWLGYPVNGFPKAGCLVGGFLGLMRATVGKKLLRQTLVSGSMRAGGQTMPESVPAATDDEAAAVAQLNEAVRRFKEHAGEYYPSPLFGRLTRDEALQLQLIHCAHHLSFLVPRVPYAS